MKHALRLLAALALSLPVTASARDRTIMLSTFDRVRVDGPFEVHLSTGEGSGATVTGDLRSADAVSVHVEGRTLVIASSLNQWGGWPGERQEVPIVTATTPDIREATVVGGGRLDIDAVDGQRVNLTVTGSGQLSVGNVSADQLYAVVAGSGALTVAGDANQARFTNSGTGHIDAEKLSVADLTVNSDGPGEGRFRAERSAAVTALGLGSISVAGDASCTVRGPGPVRCEHGSGRNRD